MELNNTTLHQAVDSDINMIIDLRIMFADELMGKQDIAVENELRCNFREYFTSELNKTCLCWYAAVDNQTVSIVTMVLRTQPGNIKNPSGRWGYIMNVFTLPLFRRLGISSMLLNKIMEHAVGLGYTAFELHATKDGEQTYIKNGFSLHTEPTYRKYVRQ